MTNNAPTDFNCPPLMEDGRFITDYRPSCSLHYEIMRNNGICSAYQFKEFMQNHADKIHQQQTEQFRYYSQCNCNKRVAPDPNMNNGFSAQEMFSLDNLTGVSDSSGNYAPFDGSYRYLGPAN